MFWLAQIEVWYGSGNSKNTSHPIVPNALRIQRPRIPADHYLNTIIIN